MRFKVQGSRFKGAVAGVLLGLRWVLQAIATVCMVAAEDLWVAADRLRA